MNEFKVVTYKKSKNNFFSKKIINLPSTDTSIDGNFDVEKCKELINTYRLQLLSSSFWKKLLELLNENVTCNEEHLFQDIVVYGIGSISQSTIAKYQLALVSLLKEHVKNDCLLHDPVVSDKEKVVFKSLGFQLITENEECKRRSHSRTLYVMLHCGKSMYNNLLWANWGHALPNTIIMGNSFSSYEERLPSRIMTKTAKYIQQILPYTKEIKIENIFQYDDIFNDTSLLMFPYESISKAPKELWDDPDEPVVSDDDVEIIKRK